MANPETRLTRRIVDALRARGRGNVLKLHGNAFQRAGEPDLLYVEEGRAFFFEVKTATGRLTRLQAHRLRQWQDAGAVAAVVRSVDEVNHALDGRWTPLDGPGGDSGTVDG